jgi:putative Holliday junction resolvase
LVARRVGFEIAPARGNDRNRRVRFLGIDHGTRRIGLSYGDELGVATPLPAITDADPAKRHVALAGVLKQRRITEVVIGHPLNMDDTAGPKAKEAEALAEALRKQFGLPVHLVDERLTSYEAESTIAKAKRRDVRASGIIDSRAATLILQDYLNQRFPAQPSEPVE